MATNRFHTDKHRSQHQYAYITFV